VIEEGRVYRIELDIRSGVTQTARPDHL